MTDSLTIARSRIAQLDERTVLLVLSHVTETLRAQLPDERLDEVQDQDEAAMAVRELLARADEQTQDPVDALQDVDQAAAHGRRLLGLLLDDPATRDEVAELLLHPPDRSQLVVETAIAAAVVLGAVVTWLQTRIHLEIVRKDGKTDVHFALTKEASDPQVVKQVATSVAQVFTGGAPS